MDVRPETLDFLDRAPLRATAERVVPATPDRVFDVLADAPSWRLWFPGVRRCEWISSEPHGVDSSREITVGPVRVEERFLVWDRPHRWGFTFAKASAPVAKAGVELVELEPVDGGRTRVRYTMALDPVVPVGPVGRLLSPPVGLSLKRGLKGLEQHLSRS